MQLSLLVKLRSVFLSLSLHIIAAALLVFSFSFTEPVKPPPAGKNVVNAVAVDKTQVEKELQRLKQEEDQKKLAEQKRLSDLEKKADELKKQRQEEEQKLLDAKKKKEAEQKQREEEQKKLAVLEKQKAELEKQRKLEEEKKKQAEEEKRKAEEEKKKLEEEKKKKEAELKRQEEERKQKEAEKALQEQLAKEQAEEQRKQDLTLQQKIARDIYDKVTKNFNRTGLPDELSCELHVKLLPGGEVIDVSVSKSSGNEIFDRRALTAVQKASPLPVPEELETFERLNLRDITFTFKP